MHSNRALFVRKAFASNKMRQGTKLKILTSMLGKYEAGPPLTWLTFVVELIQKNVKEPKKNKNKVASKVKQVKKEMVERLLAVKEEMSDMLLEVEVDVEVEVEEGSSYAP